MPSSMTHTYFACDVYHALNKKCKNKLKDNKEYFKLFSQGSDPFMFYHFLVGNRGKSIRKIQQIMHKKKTQAFFIEVTSYIHDNKLMNNGSIMAFLYGYICHYYLDLYIHPLIYYKSGIFKKEKKNTYKYNAVHQKIEYAIDCYLIEKKEKVKAQEFKVYNAIFDISELNLEQKEMINIILNNVYKIKNGAHYYESSIKYMKKFFKYFNYDPKGIKLKFYKIYDKLTPKSVIKTNELSYANKYPQIGEYLNLNNKNWIYPWDKRKIFNSSFFDLYDMALKEAVKTIEEVDTILNKDKLDIKRLKELFKNLSFVTGIDCNKKVIFKYFEF